MDKDYLEKRLNFLNLKYLTPNNEKSIGFKFLVLIDQILNNSSLEYYINRHSEKFFNIAFNHLIELFGENFVNINRDQNILLKNNFIYFMLINKGDFSDVLTNIAKKNEKFNINLKRILNETLLINKCSDDHEIEKFLVDSDKRINTASSEITNSYAFKYKTLDTKINFYNNLVYQKQNINKIKIILESYNKLCSNSDKNRLIYLEKILSSFILKESKNLFDQDFIEIKDQLESLNKYVEEIALSLSNLKILDYNRISIFNVEQIFNPIFSGEWNIERQYQKVCSTLGNNNADSIFNLYKANLKNKKGISLRDMFKLNFDFMKNNISVKEQFFNLTLDNQIKHSSEDFCINVNYKKSPTNIFPKDLHDTIMNSLQSIMEKKNKTVNLEFKKELNNTLEEEKKKVSTNEKVRNEETMEKKITIQKAEKVDHKKDSKIIQKESHTDLNKSSTNLENKFKNKTLMSDNKKPKYNENNNMKGNLNQMSKPSLNQENELHDKESEKNLSSNIIEKKELPSNNLKIDIQYKIILEKQMGEKDNNSTVNQAQESVKEETKVPKQENKEENIGAYSSLEQNFEKEKSLNPEKCAQNEQTTEQTVTNVKIDQQKENEIINEKINLESKFNQDKSSVSNDIFKNEASEKAMLNTICQSQSIKSNNHVVNNDDSSKDFKKELKFEETKKTESDTMEEKFKKQKMRKFYFSDK